MSRHVFAVVLLAVFGAVLLTFIIRPRVAHAQQPFKPAWNPAGDCSIPKSAGDYLGGYGNPYFLFESKTDKTLSII